MKSILPSDEHWRIVNYDLSDNQHMVDWTHEREWRVPGNIQFEYKNIEIIVESDIYYRKFVEFCIQNRKMDILRQINRIVVLNTIYF